MSSIPLPALGLQPIQQPDTLQKYGQLLALKNAQQQQALMQQEAPLRLQALQTQAQTGQIQLQKEQQAFKDQQAVTAAMQAWDGKDITQLPSLVLKNGGSGQTVMSLKQGIIDQQTKMAALTKDQLANEKVKNDYLAGLIDNVKGLPSEQQPAAFEAAKAQAVQRGYLDPQQAQGMQYQGPQQLAMLEKSLMGYSGFIESGLKGAQTNEATARANEANANTKKIEQQTQYGPTGDAAEAQYRYVLARLSQNLPVSDQELASAKAFELSQSKTTTQSDSLGVSSTNTSRPSGLASVGRGNVRPPANSAAAPSGAAPASGGAAAPRASSGTPSVQNTRDSIVDMIGNYKMNPTLLTRALAKHPELLAAVNDKYKDWDQTTYNAKNALITKYTSGDEGRQINAINTAMGHLAELDDAATALKNGNIQLLNKLANTVGAAVGQDAATTYRMIVHRVGPEVASAYVPGGGGEGERTAIAQDFSDSMSPDQIHSNVAKSVQLFRSKIGALENQYKNTVNRDDFSQRFLTPQARASLQRYGAGGSGNQASSPTPSTHIFSVSAWQKANPQGDANAAKVAAQAQGYQVVQ